MNLRISIRAFLAAFGVYVGISTVSAAGVDPPPVPGATASGNAEGCFNSPCVNGFGSSAMSPTVPLSQFGAGTYTLNTDHGTGGVITHPNTPGEISAPNFGLVTMNRTYPSLNVSASYYTGAGLVNNGLLDYWFEVVNTKSPGTVGAVQIGVTASGGVSGSAGDPVGTTAFAVNTMSLISQLTIASPALGVTVLNELAEAATSFEYLNGTPIESSNGTTSNVTVHFGITTTASGGFSIQNQPVSVETATPYRVRLNASMTGDLLFSGNAFVDPFLTAPPGYTLEFSAGVLNGVQSSVPEPPTWAMMALGFAGLGLAAHLGSRRRTRTLA